MKTVFYTIVLASLLSSCKSVEKMVEKGEYNKAFYYAISKLQGDKTKKTEYVKALEKAYSKLNRASLKEIEKLQPDVKPENWNRVLSLYQDMESRQELLDPLLPLISEDGYRANFNIQSYSSEIRNAEENTCLYYYNNALDLLSKTEKTGDKSWARDAYDELKKIERYRRNYRDSDKLINKALDLGLTTIQFEIFNDLRDFQSYNIERELATLAVSRLDNLWYNYRMNIGSKEKPDFTVIMELNDINFSPERERVNNYSESKEILIRKDKVKEKRDSVEVWVEKEVYEKVRADISEVFREKKSELHGRLRVMNTRSEEVIKTVPINVFYDFTGYGCRFTGDERALKDESKKKMDAFLESFPTDATLAGDLANAFRNAVLSEVKKMNFE